MDESRQRELDILLLRTLAGDDQAFEKIVNIYHNKLRFYVHHIIGDLDRADDVVQQVWIAVYAGLRHLRSIRAFHAWLYRIATLQARKEQGKLYRTLGRERSLDELPVEVEAADDRGLSETDAEELYYALKQLRPEFREVLLLRFMEDLSYEEIAQVIGYNLGTVKSRLHHAKRALLTVMEGLRK